MSGIIGAGSLILFVRHIEEPKAKDQLAKQIGDLMKRAALSIIRMGLCLAVLGSLRTGAKTFIYEARGPSRESIQPTVDQFRRDIIYGPGGSELNPPASLGWYRIASFDDVAAPDQTSNPPTSGGLRLYGFNGPPPVSAGSGDMSNPNALFGDLNPRLPGWLDAYSGSSVLAAAPAPFDGAETLAIFPDGVELTKTRSNAFGAVFVDVDYDQSVSLFWSASGGGLRSFFVPSSPGDGNFSFLGVILDDEVAYASMLHISLPWLPTDASLMAEDPLHDAVAIDDVIIGAAPPIPEPSSTALLILGVILTGIYCASAPGQSRPQRDVRTDASRKSANQPLQATAAPARN